MSPMTDLAAARHLFSLDEYHRMGATGILQEDDRVELIEGEIVEMTPVGSCHAATVGRLTQLLGDRVEGRAIVWVQNPLSIPDEGTLAGSELQPDLVLLAPRDDFYDEAHPTPADVLLLIEVGDTSLPFDRDVKLPVYAAGGVHEVWLVSLPDKTIEVHREPVHQSYRWTRRAFPGDTLEPERLPGLTIAVDEVFGLA